MIKKAFIVLLCLASLISPSCVSEKRMVRLESTLTDTQEALKDKNEELSETEFRLARNEKSWERLNTQLLTLTMVCGELQEKYSGFSEKLKDLELDFADANLQIFNRMRELEEQMGENDIDISRKVKEVQAQLESFKGVTHGSSTNEVIHLKGQVEMIENRIEEIQSKLSDNIKNEDKDTQESPYEAIKDVINRFDKYYGGPQMDEITELTTARFRENRPEAVWVSEIWKALDDLEYKRLNSVITESEIEQNRARVVLESEIQTKAGETQQTEIFYLIQKEGWWLIDKLVVADDKPDLNPLH